MRDQRRPRPGRPRGDVPRLRHTYASVLLDGGLSIRVLQARLGHASASETLGTYSHLMRDAEDRTRAVLDATFRDLLRPPRGPQEATASIAPGHGMVVVSRPVRRIL